jgi:hypothetical protein
MVKVSMDHVAKVAKKEAEQNPLTNGKIRQARSLALRKFRL